MDKIKRGLFIFEQILFLIHLKVWSTLSDFCHWMIRQGFKMVIYDGEVLSNDEKYISQLKSDLKNLDKNKKI